MSIRKSDLITQIIEPTLSRFNLWSESAQTLLLATAAQESHLGEFLVQTNGPALGIFQMEPKTYDDIIVNVIDPNTKYLKEEIRLYFGFLPSKIYFDKLIYDLRYACLFCRLQYYRYSEPLPEKTDIDGMFNYWKKYYNRNPDKGDKNQFIENYKKYVQEKQP